MNLELLYKVEEILEYNQTIIEKYYDINNWILLNGTKIKNNTKLFNKVEEIKTIYQNIFKKLDKILEELYLYK